MEKEKRTVKPIPFSNNEQNLLEWVEKQDRPFATYVKDLIRMDMNSRNSCSKEDIKQLIKEVLGEIKVDIPEQVEQKVTEKQKKSYRNSII